jgi:hypothetical protein
VGGLAQQLGPAPRGPVEVVIEQDAQMWAASGLGECEHRHRRSQLADRRWRDRVGVDDRQLATARVHATRRERVGGGGHDPGALDQPLGQAIVGAGKARLPAQAGKRPRQRQTARYMAGAKALASIAAKDGPPLRASRYTVAAGPAGERRSPVHGATSLWG